MTFSLLLIAKRHLLLTDVLGTYCVVDILTASLLIGIALARATIQRTCSLCISSMLPEVSKTNAMSITGAQISAATSICHFRLRIQPNVCTTDKLPSSPGWATTVWTNASKKHTNFAQCFIPERLYLYWYKSDAKTLLKTFPNPLLEEVW